MLAKCRHAPFPRPTRVRGRSSTTMRASSRPTGETPKDEDEPDVLIPEGVAWTSTEDRRMVEALRRRARVISQLKLQRSRVSVGDYVSDEVTKFRGERFRIERQIVAMRKDLEARTTLGRFQEADALKNPTPTRSPAATESRARSRRSRSACSADTTRSCESPPSSCTKPHSFRCLYERTV